MHLSVVVIVAGMIGLISDAAVVIPPQPQIPDLLLAPLKLLVEMASQWYQKNGNQCIFYYYENFYYVSI